MIIFSLESQESINVSVFSINVYSISRNVSSAVFSDLRPPAIFHTRPFPFYILILLIVCDHLSLRSLPAATVSVAVL